MRVTIAALLMLVGTAFADPVTYDLVANVVGRFEGSKPVGTITFADGSLGSTSYDIATAGTEFDLDIADYPSPVAGWKSGDTGISANGMISFSTGAIGDATLIPFQYQLTPDFSTFARWEFRFDSPALTGPPTGPADLSLSLYADSYSAGWGWQTIGQTPVLGDFTDVDQPINVVEWELRLAAPVPEPGTFVMFGAAALGAYVIRRRRNAS